MNAPTEVIPVGSYPFFKDIPGYHPKDRDYVRFEEFDGYSKQQSMPGVCIFTLSLKQKTEHIQYSITHGEPMSLNRYLVPDVANIMGVTIEDLKKLKRLRDGLDDKHKYLAVIYDSYIKNNSFTLTRDQRQEAYDVYNKYRKNNHC